MYNIGISGYFAKILEKTFIEKVSLNLLVDLYSASRISHKFKTTYEDLK